MSDCDREFDRSDVPYLEEFAMWAVVLLAVATPISLLGQAIALHRGQPALADGFYNATMAVLNIAIGLTVWPMLYVGLLELWRRTPDAIQESRDYWLDQARTWEEKLKWLVKH